MDMMQMINFVRAASTEDVQWYIKEELEAMDHNALAACSVLMVALLASKMKDILEMQREGNWTADTFCNSPLHSLTMLMAMSTMPQEVVDQIAEDVNYIKRTGRLPPNIEDRMSPENVQTMKSQFGLKD